MSVVLRPSVEQWQKRVMLVKLVATLKRGIDKIASEMDVMELMGVELGLRDSMMTGLESVRTPGSIKRTLYSHPLFPVIQKNLLRLEKEKEEDDPESYLGPFSKLSTTDIMGYFIWKADHKNGGLDDWKRERAKYAKIKGIQSGGQPDSGSGERTEGRDSSGSNETIQIQKKEVKAYGPKRKKETTP